MLFELLLRDLRLHRRVLLAGALLPLFFIAVVAWSPGARQNTAGSALLLCIFGLLLLALLPLSLQVREGMLRTLDDLLALPIRRSDLVRLRFAEGLLACLGFNLLFIAAWSLINPHGAAAMAKEVLRSPALLWVLLLCLAYPLPFYLRWRGLGVLGGYGLLGLGLYLLFVRGLRQDHPTLGFRGMDLLHRLHERGTLGAALVDYGLPLALLALCYAFALWAAERMEA